MAVVTLDTVLLHIVTVQLHGNSFLVLLTNLTSSFFLRDDELDREMTPDIYRPC